MGNEWNSKWGGSSPTYSESQVESSLNEAGVEIISETETHFLCYCPFHGNTDTPAFAVDKTTGLFYCFNPACEVAGNLEKLIRQLLNLNPYEALRFILKHKGAKPDPAKAVEAALADKFEFEEYPLFILDRAIENFWNEERAVSYMRGRGFSDHILDLFEIGYFTGDDRILVPMHDPTGMPIGYIGRTVAGKRFQNSKDLPKNRTLFNLHRARKHSTVIICEASFDAMRIHQAGYPNVVALIGGSISSHHVAQIKRYFSEVVIMTDDDPLQFYENCRKCLKAGSGLCRGHNPGRVLADKIEQALSGEVRVKYARWSYETIYPHGAKDAGDMTDEEITTCIKNARSFALELAPGNKTEYN